MIITELYKGQGLGNQIWCYVTTRVLALDKGFDFGIKSPENFKALDFMDLDFGKQVFGGNGPEGGPPKTLPDGIKYYYNENKITHPNGSDIRNIDKNLINNLKDNTKVDGLLQGEKYIEHRKKEIREWLKVREEFEFYDFSNDNICIINFRGGGYAKDKDFFLSDDYWRDAVNNMLKINPDFKFIVITDDVKTAKKFFPKFEVYHFDITKDYVVIKNARYLIMSNSSFAWFPTWLNENLKYCIAPKYWGRHNFSDGYWSLESNITKGWNYQDRDGNLQDYDSCIKELEEYKQKNKNIFLEECNFDIKEIYHPKNLETIDKKYIMSLKKISRGLIYRSKLFIKRSISFVLGSLLPSSFTERASLRENFQFVKTEKEARKKWLSENEIKEYRKKIKIYDVFTFFNELDLLEIRLNILDPYVDYFVIVEATETFSGYPKPLYYEENKERFKKWKDKIIHYVIDDTPKDEDELRSKLYLTKNLTLLDKQIIKDSLTSDR